MGLFACCAHASMDP